MAHRALLCLIVFGLLVVSPGALAKGPEPLAQTISHLVRKARLGDRIGIEIVRLHDGAQLYQKHAKRPLNPASNQKLLTAAAALWNLGPTFRASTKAEGILENGTVKRLILRAAGDPSLGYRALFALAQALRLRGVDRVEQIVIDDSYFDRETLPPAFDQQPGETAAFRAPITAFSVDHNSYVVHVGPGPKVGAQGRVRVLADGYIVIKDETTTKSSGPPKIQIDHKSTKDGRLEVRVRGQVPATARTLYYRRRIPDPRAHAASLWVRALRQAGMGGALEVEYAHVTERLPVLADMPSGELSGLLYSVGKWSDNFTAEMLLKIMGAEAQTPGTSARGIEVVREELASRGVDVEGLIMINGSGLFDGNQVSPHHITQTLVTAYRDPAIRAEYVSQLAVGGADGTLQSRLRNLPRPRMVRAKTGTLRDVVALSGYVLGEAHKSIAFSFLANGIAGKQAAARDLVDQIVTRLAEYATQPEPARH
ncbi:MAG: D-alanyl-D-alanine carboxypeptidase/D-alanyl-D-alanine-endopeptidase [Myxococcales bacterium]|nr:D-alanyl-D-alanine carboxypeptidase/D-alanyl-D-alanine-endopeptidase [Myxococcales bacterium]